MSQTPSGLKGLVHELKTKRWIQVALALIILLGIYVLWPDSHAPRRRGSGQGGSSTRIEPAQLQALKGLADLARLHRAGEMPKEDRLYRDVFLFDFPAPPPPKPKPVPPPPPPTPAELAAAKLKAARLAEQGAQPSQLRYLGYLNNVSSGRIGAFMKGEESITMHKGDLANPRWRLTELTDDHATFQNLTYADLRYTLRAIDAQGGGRTGPGSRAQSNQF
nr:hypothetical protein [uncultured Holophaga sp.]